MSRAKIASEMPTYFDSSILLAALLDQPGKEALVPLWDNEPERVSSVLTEAECVTVLRRVAKAQPAELAEAFLDARLEMLDRYLDGISLMGFDGEIARCLREEARLGACRTLDAVHLATAILIREQSQTTLALCSQDARMRRVAADLGFAVVP